MTGEEICHRIRRYLARSYQAGVPIRAIKIVELDWLKLGGYLSERYLVPRVQWNGTMMAPWGPVRIESGR